jgi:hypothetical protein
VTTPETVETPAYPASLATKTSLCGGGKDPSTLFADGMAERPVNQGF